LNNAKLNFSERTIIVTEANMTENSFFPFFLNQKKKLKIKKTENKKNDLKKKRFEKNRPL
jgi:hypothetical protein